MRTRGCRQLNSGAQENNEQTMILMHQWPNQSQSFLGVIGKGATLLLLCSAFQSVGKERMICHHGAKASYTKNTRHLYGLLNQ